MPADVAANGLTLVMLYSYKGTVSAENACRAVENVHGALVDCATSKDGPVELSNKVADSRVSVGTDPGLSVSAVAKLLVMTIDNDLVLVEECMAMPKKAEAYLGVGPAYANSIALSIMLTLKTARQMSCSASTVIPQGGYPCTRAGDCSPVFQPWWPSVNAVMLRF